jgi:hypothetical protein
VLGYDGLSVEEAAEYERDSYLTGATSSTLPEAVDGFADESVKRETPYCSNGVN